MKKTPNKISSDAADAELVRAYRAGEEEAFRALVERHIGHLYAFVRRLVGSEVEAEDITQTSFVRAWRHLSNFDVSRSFKVWLFSIAKNAALDFFKKKKPVLFSDFDINREGFDPLDLIADPAPLPDEVLSRANLATELTDVLNQLPPPVRIVLHLHYNDELTFREIAEVLGEPLDTIKSRHRRGLLRLRERLLPRQHQNQ